jgi:hypothetical protein
MQSTFSTLYLKSPGTIFMVVDEVLLGKMPELRGQSLTLSVIKRIPCIGAHTYVQYIGPKGAGTMKLSRDYEIEITGESDNPTLSSLITKYMGKTKRPNRIKVGGNGQAMEYTINYEFWEQNHKNIRLKGLSRFGDKYKVPGAFLVLDEKFD